MSAALFALVLAVGSYAGCWLVDRVSTDHHRRARRRPLPPAGPRQRAVASDDDPREHAASRHGGLARPALTSCPRCGARP